MSQSSTVWQCPVGVTHIVFEAWGAGGVGSGNSGFARGGAGGGGYCRGRCAVTAGLNYTILRGIGDAIGSRASEFHQGGTFVRAHGGANSDYNPAAGGSSDGSAKQVGFSGGNGAAHSPNDQGSGGGGGGGASREGAGNDAVTTTGGAGRVSGAGGTGGAPGAAGGTPGTGMGNGGAGCGKGGTGNSALGSNGAWMIWNDTNGEVGGGGGGFTPVASAFITGEGDYPEPPAPTRRREGFTL